MKSALGAGAGRSARPAAVQVVFQGTRPADHPPAASRRRRSPRPVCRARAAREAGQPARQTLAPRRENSSAQNWPAGQPAVLTQAWPEQSVPLPEVQRLRPRPGGVGRRFAVRGATVFELAGGRIRRSSDYADAATILRQLGLLPTPGTPTA
jgi:hypothetical protein